MLTRIIATTALLLATSPALAFFIQPGPETDLYEYVNDITGHYVMLDSGEASKVDAGSAGAGWERTGYVIGEYWDPTRVPGAIPVCRFYSPTNNSHFITANAAECEGLKDPSSGWLFEKTAFYVTDLGPVCTTGQSPVFRLYNNRHAFHDANHRFTPDPQVRAQMIALGWVDEGVAFCTRAWYDVPQKIFQVRARTIEDASSCESRAGACVALRQLAPMPNFIYSFLPPWYVNKNPDYPYAAQSLTGTFVDLYTGQDTADIAAVANHSFVQMYSIGGPPYGMHVAGSDRLTGPYASISPMYEFPGAVPPSGAVDERLFPWKGLRYHTLVATFNLKVATLRRSDPSSYAYGGLVLQFGDAASGHSFYTTVQVYGSVPPGDFAAPDATTGIPIVSTVFRGDPAFGARLAGDFVACDGQAQTACIPSSTKYQFRIDAGDFTNALERARTIDPSLSSDVSNYFVGQMRLQNETYGEAEIGATVDSLQLDVWY